MVEKYGSDTSSKKILIFVAFFIVAFFLLYFAFSQTNITGVIIQDDSDQVVEEGKKIKTNLNPPKNITFDQSMDRIKLVTSSGSSIYVGDKKTDLSNLDKVELIFKDYNGMIFFSNKEIFNLNGVSSEVLVNGISITSTGGDTEVMLSDLNYDKLELNNIYLDELSYETSGNIDIDKGKSKLNLNNEVFDLSGFKGSLIMGNKLELDGECESLSAGDISIGDDS